MRWTLLVCVAACATAPEPAPSIPSASATSTAVPAIAAPEPIDPHGSDDRPSAEIELPSDGELVKLGRHWGALERICDLAVHGDALYMAHATEPLALGGATITRYVEGAPTPFSLVFDWNRPGEPETGGGAAGQGFLRIRRIDGRLFVPDADPPYLGFRIAPGMAEGYVFASGTDGKFERAGAGHRPPKSALVLPGALHVFDAIRFRGKLYVSSSAIVPASGKHAASPGTLFVEPGEPGPWKIAFTHAGATPDGARLGYMVRFRDRLYVALSPLSAADRDDYVVISPPREVSEISPEHARSVRATRAGAAHTLRWYADRSRLYWISASADGVELRVTSDGDRWTRLELPADAGHPADVLRVGERLLVLAERALLELVSDGFRVVARIADTAAFRVDDGYCAPPLAVYRDKLYAGSQKRGALYVLAPRR